MVVYLAIIQGVGLAVKGWAELTDGKLLTVDHVFISMWIPLGTGPGLHLCRAHRARWWKPVLRDERPVQKWIRFIPALIVVVILVGTGYANLSERGLGFTLALLVATQFVGWGEEGKFRGLGVVNSVLHGLFDFSILSATAITVETKASAALAAPILLYIVTGIVLIARRKHIELPTVAPELSNN